MSAGYDYDKLSVELRPVLAGLVAKDNLENSNQYYKEPEFHETIYTKYIKRLLDILIALVAVIVSFPINVVVLVVTYFDVGRPVLFRQQRVAKDGKLFTMVKFRNMTNAKDENGVLLRAEQRVTRWGKLMRSTSLDELLNFYNILKGDMSIIGPRPLPLSYRDRFNRYHSVRHAVRPGLDCPLRDPSKLMTWQNRLDNDAWYAEHVSFKTDMILLFLLVHETLFGRDKKARARGFGEGSFIGYNKDGTVMDSNHIPEEYYLKLKEEG